MGKWKPDAILPYLVTCPVDFTGEIPKYVSLTSEYCSTVTNKFKVIDNHPPDGVKKDFVVVVKAMAFENRNIVIRFIEWVEMLKILGCEKIIIFERIVHPDLMMTLNFYQKQGFMDVYRFVEPEEITSNTYTNIQSFMLQQMQHTDSFYRARNLYKYFVIIDVDELIIPMRPEDKTWHDLVTKRYNMNRGTVSFMSLNTIFSTSANPSISDVSDNFYMLKHTEVKS